MTAPTPFTTEYFESLDSTSLHARRVVATAPAPEPVLYVAAEQTGGVGRFARPWASPRGGLWCTLLWPASTAPTGVLDGLGLRVGVACFNTIREALGPAAAGLDVRLKWPNDVLINDKKVLGVLCEVVTRAPPPMPSYILVGVGVNANLDVDGLPERLRATATTLRVATGHDTDLSGLASTLVEHLTRALTSRGLDPATLAAARANLARVGQATRVTLPDRSTIEGTLVGLDDHGTPVLDTAEGRVTLPSGAELL